MNKRNFLSEIVGRKYILRIFNRIRLAKVYNQFKDRGRSWEISNTPAHINFGLRNVTNEYD
jgi:hypothetical protein